jgi:hypothetical protein
VSEIVSSLRTLRLILYEFLTSLMLDTCSNPSPPGRLIQPSYSTNCEAQFHFNRAMARARHLCSQDPRIVWKDTEFHYSGPTETIMRVLITSCVFSEALPFEM